MYSYSCLSAPAKHKELQRVHSHLEVGHGRLLANSHNMVVHFGFGVKLLTAVLAGVSKGAREVEALHMFPQVASVIAGLATYSAPVRPGPTLRVPHDIIIQRLLTTCNQNMASLPEN